jgi:hypothetical protein
MYNVRVLITSCSTLVHLSRLSCSALVNVSVIFRSDNPPSRPLDQRSISSHTSLVQLWFGAPIVLALSVRVSVISSSTLVHHSRSSGSARFRVSFICRSDVVQCSLSLRPNLDRLSLSSSPSLARLSFGSRSLFHQLSSRSRLALDQVLHW